MLRLIDGTSFFTSAMRTTAGPADDGEADDVSSDAEALAEALVGEIPETWMETDRRRFGDWLTRFARVSLELRSAIGLSDVLSALRVIRRDPPATTQARAERFIAFIENLKRGGVTEL